ncbi:MAG: hypothetical protein JWO36_1036 [Myxococcales bacterium]|nr:hypothetical protein [Myxococcales bacterium]
MQVPQVLLRFGAPSWGLVPTLVLALLCASVVPAVAQPMAKPADKAAKADPKPDGKLGDSKANEKAEKKKVQNFDFNAMNLNGASRTPQLLYFLERANEELERAFLERRSFIPHLVRSIDEEAL